MAGHSKWSKIKRAKAVNDQKKGAIFTKISHEITQAAKQGDLDPDRNFSLRLAIEKAKEVNMPKANIQRAIDKASGSDTDELNTFQQISYEGLWKDGIVFIVDCLTDNNNRTVSDLKLIIEKNGGTLADPGSVSWQFNTQGEVIIGAARLEKSEKHGQSDYYKATNLELLEASLLEINGILDFEVHDNTDVDKYPGIKFLRVNTEPTDLHAVTQELVDAKWLITSAELVKIPSQSLEYLPNELLVGWEGFCEKVGNYDDVEAIWDNISESQNE